MYYILIWYTDENDYTVKVFKSKERATNYHYFITQIMKYSGSLYTKQFKNISNLYLVKRNKKIIDVSDTDYTDTDNNIEKIYIKHENDF